MANMTISNPGIGQFFSGIAQALAGPSPQALIAVDQARAQRDNTLSSTAINREKLAVMQRQEAAMSSLADVLGDPTLAQTPEGRASLASILSQVPDGLQYGPGFATGMSSFVDPNFVQSDSDFSRILSGTGVQPWAQTPAGQSADLSNNLDQERIRQEGETARALLPNNHSLTPLDVSPTDAAGLSKAVVARLDAMFPGAEVDPATLQDIAARAAQLYQQTRNAPAAIDQAIQDFGPKSGGRHFGGLLPWDWSVPDPVKNTQTPQALGTPVLPMAAPAAAAAVAPPAQQPSAPPAADPGAPASPAAAAVGGAAKGAVEGMQTGRDPASGQYFVVQGDKRVPIQNGQTAVSPSTGKRIIFVDGAWYPVSETGQPQMGG